MKKGYDKHTVERVFNVWCSFSPLPLLILTPSATFSLTPYYT